jgi:hypothetical protein
VWDDVPLFLTVVEAGRLLRIGRSKAYGLTAEYERTGGRSGLPFVWFGSQKRVPREALARFVDAQLRLPRGG